ncbi:DNA recombination protein RmuC [Roseococcus sp. DSY-14]|uniref:DNA recombination protein RmuC n=1 Tax=Roseococcus sp. DSY-14 TaxID=3369650 RepID=UPI00387AF79C
MSLEATLLLAVLAIQALLLAALLLRRPPTDPALATCQQGVERQGERLGELLAEQRTLPERAAALTGEKLAAVALDQAKALAAVQAALTDRLAADAKAAREEQATRLDALREASDRLATAIATAAQEEKLAVETLRTRLAEDAQAGRKEQAEKLDALRQTTDTLTGRVTAALTEEAQKSRDVLDRKLTEMRETSEKRLAEIQRSVNEQLAGAVEKQMSESFQRVIDQFAAIQQMMGNVQSVAAQVGDLKRLFGNVKTRGGWGEAQLKQMLDDFLPAGAYDSNVQLREGSQDAVEFCIRMPGGDADRALLPLDSKFPSEDYERLLAAQDAADAEGEKQARRAIEARVRAEARKIAEKYICPPRTTAYAILFLPTEGLYAEVARLPGLVDLVAREHRVFIAGPFLLPALLKNIHLGYATYALSKNAEGIRDLLSATKEEMAKMDGVLERLGKQVGTVSNTIGDARTRTRAIARKLRGVEALPDGRGAELLELDAPADEEG